METQTWMLIYKTDTTQDLTVIEKKMFSRCESDYIEHALWSHPLNLILKHLLVGLTKTLSFRQDLLPLSGIADAMEETKRASRREENKKRTNYSSFSKASGQQQILSWPAEVKINNAFSFFRGWDRLLWRGRLPRPSFLSRKQWPWRNVGYL